MSTSPSNLTPCTAIARTMPFVHMDGTHDSDSRINFGNLNTVQFSAGLPSYIQSIRQHHPHSDVGDHDSSPTHSISPQLPPCLPQISGTDSSSGGGRSTSTSSPASSCGCVEQGPTLVHHRALHGNSTSSVATITSTTTGVGMTLEHTKAAARRSSTSTSNTAADDDFASDEDNLPHARRKKSVSKCYKQHIESTQRRCDKLRDVCCRLKDVLPVSNQKSSKVSVLNSVTMLIRQLEVTQTHMIMKINELEAETARLRIMNKMLMLRAAEQHRSSTGLGAF